jgi:hypothetical protein
LCENAICVLTHTPTDTQMDLVVIEGHFHAHALVKVKLDDSCPPEFSPLLTSYRPITEASVWVYHEAATKTYQQEIASFLSTFVPKLAGTREELVGAVTDLTEELMRQFVVENLYDYPVYDMEFGTECCPRSEAVRR